MQMEEAAGVGLGIVLCVALFFVTGLWARWRRSALVTKRTLEGLIFSAASVIALLVYMAKISSEATSRLLAAYYIPLVIAVLVLAPLGGMIVRRRFFQGFGLAAVLSALPLVILSPARPLFPVAAVTALVDAHAPVALAERFDRVYTVYGSRADPLARLRTLLPANENKIGFVQNGNAAETSL